MENNWVVYGSDWYHKEVANQVKKLDKAIYKLQNGLAGLYLVKMEDKFDLPKKVYGVETDFVERVVRTYGATEGNLGLLLNGVKGTGKTVTAKLIANKLDMPVIVVTTAYKAIPDYLNELQEDVVLFFDEYEKTYNSSEDDDEKDSSILSVMDGVLSNQYRKVFLLTTNKAWVNENMLQRPGRIRYHKEFEDLSLKTIIEIVDDKLEYTEARDATIKFISELEIITIDIVSAVVDEVNIHEQAPEVFKDVFNVKPMDNVFDVVEALPDGTSIVVASRVKVNPSEPRRSHVGGYFYVNEEHWGVITEVLKDKGVKVKGHRPTEDEDGKVERKITTYYIKESVGIHRSFHEYAF